MSTRAAIGRVAGDGFEGRYHHSDGYPTWLGKHFTERARTAPDLAAFLAYIVDEHRAGWSSLGISTEYRDGGFVAVTPYDRCYCHWEGREEPNEGEPITECDLFIEWAYAIDAERRTLGVWASVNNGAHGYTGKLIAVVSIDDPDIDWEGIERDGEAAKEAAYTSTAAR